MEIDKVYYINRDEETERNYSQRVLSFVMHVPPIKLERHVVQDNSGYHENADIIADIIDDGFVEYEWFLDPKNAGHIWQRVKNLSVFWNHLKVLRKIVERNERAIVVEDDTFLDKSFYGLEDDITAIRTDFDVLWLESWWWPRDASEFKLQMQLESNLQPMIGLPFIHKNYYGLSSRARYFSPEGADRFMRMCLDAPWYSTELVGWFHAVKGGDCSRFLLHRPSCAQMVDLDLVDKELKT